MPNAVTVAFCVWSRDSLMPFKKLGSEVDAIERVEPTKQLSSFPSSQHATGVDSATMHSELSDANCARPTGPQLHVSTTASVMQPSVTEVAQLRARAQKLGVVVQRLASFQTLGLPPLQFCSGCSDATISTRVSDGADRDSSEVESRHIRQYYGVSGRSAAVAGSERSQLIPSLVCRKPSSFQNVQVIRSCAGDSTPADGRIMGEDAEGAGEALHELDVRVGRHGRTAPAEERRTSEYSIIALSSSQVSEIRQQHLADATLIRS
eukprot:5119786-Pleurochrysis_carterae.AAC.3